MQGTYIPQYTPVPPTAVPIEVSSSPSIKVEWRGNRTLTYYVFVHLLFERGLKVLYGVVAGSFQLIKWGLHISFSFCFLSFLFLLFSNPSFLFLKLFARALVLHLFCCTAGHGIKTSVIMTIFSPCTWEGDGKRQENKPSRQTAKPKEISRREDCKRVWCGP